MCDYGEALTNDDLADIHDKKVSGRPARTLPVSVVVNWAVNNPGTFFVHPTEDTIHLIKEVK